MSKLSGLVDTLEVKLLEAKSVLFTGNVLVDKQELLSIIDKIKLVLQEVPEVKAVVSSTNQLSLDDKKIKRQPLDKELRKEAPKQNNNERATAIVSEAFDHADRVFSNLQLVTTKFQKSVVQMEEHLKNLRELIDKNKPKMKIDSLKSVKEGTNHEQG